MKKAIIAIALLGAATATQAQQKGLWIGPSLSGGAGTLVQLPASYQSSSVSVLTAGVDLQQMFSDRFGLGAGLAYGGYGCTVEWRDDSGISHDEFTQHSIDIPVYARWVWGKRNGFFANVGFVNNIWLKATDKGYIASPSGLVGVNFENDHTEQLIRHYSLSPFVCFGGNFTVRNRQLTVGPQVQYQATRNFKALSDGQYLTFSLKAALAVNASKDKSKAQHPEAL